MSEGANSFIPAVLQTCIGKNANPGICTISLLQDGRYFRLCSVKGSMIAKKGANVVIVQQLHDCVPTKLNI